MEDLKGEHHIVPVGAFFRFLSKSFELEGDLNRRIQSIFFGCKRDRYDKFFTTRYGNISKDLYELGDSCIKMMEHYITKPRCTYVVESYLIRCINKINDRIERLKMHWELIDRAKKDMRWII